MTDFNNDVMHRLVDEFQLEQGQTGFAGADAKDFYVHGQSGLPLLTKRGIGKIRDKRKFRHDTPTIQDVGGRVIVSGWWIDDEGERKIWTTGEANPSDVSRKGNATVEGNHPAAIAEKRFETRGVIALECGKGSGVYGKDEFNKEFFSDTDPEEPRSEQPKPKAQTKQRVGSPPIPEYANELPNDWSNQCAAISEYTGTTRGTFEGDLWQHCIKFWSAAAEKFFLPKALNIADLVKEGNKPGTWALSAVKEAKAVAAALKAGDPVALVHSDGNGAGVESITLNPTALGDDGSGKDKSVLDDPDIPF